MYMFMSDESFGVSWNHKFVQNGRKVEPICDTPIRQLVPTGNKLAQVQAMLSELGAAKMEQIGPSWT